MVPKYEIQLSDEQQLFVDLALAGKNILVDACIGSGKTTAIQQLCNVLPSDKKILYLTYNKLLKLDAKRKIHQRNVTVTNYHGFAYSVLKREGKSADVSDLIQMFIKEVDKVEPYDVLIIDEYQDINQELSELLEIVKASNPSMQIIAVGDMEQKIYDNTTLDVGYFIDIFLDAHENLEFTKCFRLSADLASMLGRVWKKRITGVNKNCLVTEMDLDEVVSFLAQQEPEDVLCLGARSRNLAKTLNELETRFPEKYNKSTVYASISERDSATVTEPRSTSAIFTTYDSSKGLERKICVIFDFTEFYWWQRIRQPQTSYEILRNIFCVAASRGKEGIIFVREEEERLSEETLSTYVKTSNDFRKFDMSQMFDFKYKEDVEKCFAQLKVSKIGQDDNTVIAINSRDELIDLSPCIGIYQEAVFFDNYNIDFEIELSLYLKNKSNLFTDDIKLMSLDKKILYLTALNTGQKRYRSQVSTPFVTEEQKQAIVNRLKTHFINSEQVQVRCELHFADKDGGTEIFPALGCADVVKDNIVYELKFVSEIKHEHFLQCASYMAALGLTKGVVWNTRDNTMYSVEIVNKKEFLNCVTRTITKGAITQYYKAGTYICDKSWMDYEQEIRSKKLMNNFAVIDTETTWDDQVMSIGVVIADGNTKEILDSKYYLIDPEYKKPGMYSNMLNLPNIKNTITDSRKSIIYDIGSWLRSYGVEKILAYNASYDKGHLPELSEFSWCDIMRLAAYRQYNKSIPVDADCHATGKLKKGYSVEAILRMLGTEKNYTETHNAYYDAMDELKIVQLLGYGLDAYNIAILDEKKTSKKKMQDRQDCSYRTQADERITETEKKGDIDDCNTIAEDLAEKITDCHMGERNSQNQGQKQTIQTYTASEAANILGVSKSAIYNMIKRGDFPASKNGNKYEIPIDGFNEYIKRKKNAQRFALILVVGLGIAMIILLLIMLSIL